MQATPIGSELASPVKAMRRARRLCIGLALTVALTFGVVACHTRDAWALCRATTPTVIRLETVRANNYSTHTIAHCKGHHYTDRDWKFCWYVDSRNHHGIRVNCSDYW